MCVQQVVIRRPTVGTTDLVHRPMLDKRRSPRFMLSPHPVSVLTSTDSGRTGSKRRLMLACEHPSNFCDPPDPADILGYLGPSLTPSSKYLHYSSPASLPRSTAHCCTCRPLLAHVHTHHSILGPHKLTVSTPVPTLPYSSHPPTPPHHSTAGSYSCPRRPGGRCTRFGPT